MDELGQALLTLARNAIAARFGLPPENVAVNRQELQKNAATFVTLTQHEALRGCIGTLEAWRPLAQDVAENACNAAFRDPRFKPLEAEEFARTRIEVSLLTPPESLNFINEADALAQLRPMVDGVIFRAGAHRSTFLPQVWEQLPDPDVFMAHLKQKAGLPAAFWGADVHLERYAVKKWKAPPP